MNTLPNELLCIILNYSEYRESVICHRSTKLYTDLIKLTNDRCIMKITFPYYNEELFEVRVVSKKLIVKLKKCMKKNPKVMFHYYDGNNDIGEHYGRIKIKISTDKLIIDSLLKLQKFTGNIGKTSVIESLCIDVFDDDKFSILQG